MADSILRKPLTGILLLAGAAGGPYVLMETNPGRQVSEVAGNVWSGGDRPSGGIFTGLSGGDGDSNDPYWGLTGNDPSAHPLNPNSPDANYVPPQIHSLREVLRFDIDAGWVTQRFSRVSTVLGDLQLDGLRVALVTGTTPGDVAGTLTYYFDRYKRLQRITVHGVTGDPNRVVSELQSTYQLSQEPSLGGGLYLQKWNGRPTSVLHLAPAPVIHANAPYARFNVFVELNLPGLEYGLSREAEAFVNAGRATNRW